RLVFSLATISRRPPSCSGGYWSGTCMVLFPGAFTGRANGPSDQQTLDHTIVHTHALRRDPARRNETEQRVLVSGAKSGLPESAASKILRRLSGERRSAAGDHSFTGRTTWKTFSRRRRSRPKRERRTLGRWRG